MTYSKLEKFLKLSSITLLLMPILSEAQTTVEKADKQEFSKHEIGISWGAFPTSGAIVGVSFGVPGKATLFGRSSILSWSHPLFAHRESRDWEGPNLKDTVTGEYYRENEYFTMQHYGALTFNYQYHFTQRHSLGFSGTWLGRHISNYTRRPHGNSTDEVIDAKGWDNTFSLCINYRFTYYHKEAISIYTAIHLGVAVKLIARKLLFASEKNNYWSLPLQITGFGIEAGKTHAFVTELGFGAQGLIKIGYRYKFNNKE